ncbi:MAG: TrkH family potassium uptake protein [Tannerellaceae bacterium]|jgi:trk system potassium uptake protein TrkH|nr:TrkH family potassium uptake protein [Tannerellaceae bacterium]
MNLRFIIKMLGLVFLFETIFMAAATVVAYCYAEGDFVPFCIACASIGFAGIVFYLLGRKDDEHSAGPREGMIVVALTWVCLSLFGMLPYYLGGYADGVTNAFFETMAGFTTTGSTIMTDIEALPHGILFWRSLTQWQGGLGVVVFTAALLPLFGGGVSQMFEAEVTGTGISHERFRPRVTQVAKMLSGIYIMLTAVLCLLLVMGPMDWFDALNHAMTTVSTGGFSTKNASLSFWDSAYLEYVEMIFMFVGSVNVTLLYFLLRGNFRKFFADEELRWFACIIVIFVGATAAWLLLTAAIRLPDAVLPAAEELLRKSAFQVISLISSSGFTIDDYVPWGSFFWLLAMMLMFIGGCTGSTSGGLKAGRFAIVNKNLSNVFRRQMHPQAILPVRMNGHAISSDNVYRCLAFTFVYIALAMTGSLALTLCGFEFDEAIAASLSAISNIGPGLGEHGPDSTFANASAPAKWLLSFLMLTGRLEIFTVLMLLVPGFWKR